MKIIPAAVWMFVIYWLSDRPAIESSVQSGSITMKMIKASSGLTGLGAWDQLRLALFLEPYIREAAHTAEYAFLAVLVLTAVSAFAAGPVRTAFIAFLICFLYACTDEWHQMFIPGRAFQAVDIALDAAGAASVVVIYLIAVTVRRKKTSADRS